jgi:hypothetical protein
MNRAANETSTERPDWQEQLAGEVHRRLGPIVNAARVESGSALVFPRYKSPDGALITLMSAVDSTPLHSPYRTDIPLDYRITVETPPRLVVDPAGTTIAQPGESTIFEAFSESAGQQILRGGDDKQLYPLRADEAELLSWRIASSTPLVG